LALQTNKRHKATKKARKTADSAPRDRSHQRTRPSPGPDAAAQAAIADALIHQAKGSSLDQAITRALKTAGTLTPAGRRQTVQTLYAINRHRGRLTWHLEQEKMEATPSALMSAWKVFASTGGHWDDLAGVEDLALMRRLARRRVDDPAMPEAVRLECPPHFEPYLRKALGSSFAREMHAALEIPPVDLRVNTLKAKLTEAIKRLHWDKVEAVPTTMSPWGLRCPPETNVSATRAFQDGLVEFQDEASQLAALLCDAQPGQQVLDFCSGTGGKTLALAAAMQNRGHIVATDISDVRLARAKVRMKRAGAENAERLKLPPEDNKEMKKLHGKFHRVLVDAPCSGTGSWRRNPDVRWSTHAANIEELVTLQASILQRASRFVHAGGHLVYATCSLLPEENENQVARFLAANPTFEAVDAREVWSRVSTTPWPCGSSDQLRLSPAQNGTDGFFAAVLRKASIQA
jgi:16S rRNA (cytosine967-C5)-methyltransferase